MVFHIHDLAESRLCGYMKSSPSISFCVCVGCGVLTSIPAVRMTLQPHLGVWGQEWWEVWAVLTIGLRKPCRGSWCQLLAPPQRAERQESKFYRGIFWGEKPPFCCGLPRGKRTAVGRCQEVWNGRNSPRRGRWVGKGQMRFSEAHNKLWSHVVNIM